MLRHFLTFLIGLWLMLLLPGLVGAVESPATSLVAVPQEKGIEVPVARVAVLAFRPKHMVLARWQALVEYFNREVDDARFVLNAYTNDELDEAVAAGEVDFLLVQPSHYVRMTHTHGLSSPLAMLVNLQGGEAVSHFGGVIFTMQGRDDIQGLRDLRGKRIATVDPLGLGGYQMQAFELLEHGVRLPRDAELVITGQPQDLIVAAVLEGRADAGFVRTGVLESLAAAGRLSLDDLRLLNPYPRENGFPFVTSTRLYPEWPFATMAHVEPDLARRVAAALLAIPHRGEVAEQMGIVGFTIPGDYRHIDALLRALRQPPFEQAPDFTLRDVWEQWKPYLTGSLGMLAGLLLLLSVYLWVQNRRLQRAQYAMQKAHDALSEQSRQRELALDSLAQANTELTRLGEVMSHHFQEPVRRLMSYSGIIRHRMAQHDDELTQHSLGYIYAEAQRLSDLVREAQRYLSLSHSPPTDPEAVDTLTILQRSLSQLELGAEQIHIESELPSLRFDAMRLGWLFTILLDNAYRYRHPSRPLSIRLQAETTVDSHLLRVIDNGSGIPVEYRERVFGPFTRLVTSEIAGVGIGLALAKKMVRQAGGHIHIEDGDLGGCCVVISLPKNRT